jgi:hypothetical protein
LSSRRREPAAKSQASTVLSTPASPASTPSAVPTAMTPSAVANKDSVTEEPSNEVTQIRSKVLELLEQYDEGKVNRIDIIMDKFKGKEALLLEKMTQRYQAGAALPATSVQKRNEMALERHRIRMQKIREKKEQNGTGPI